MQHGNWWLSWKITRVKIVYSLRGCDKGLKFQRQLNLLEIIFIARDLRIAFRAVVKLDVLVRVRLKHTNIMMFMCTIKSL